ncbi:MAG: AAA family ATPase, partial [Nanoarchaeota archaeon]
MLLRKLVLHNIRSYTDATLEFPQGIVLLSGDIGAGKTTILLAIEFALFGIQRGEISGSALLRHGENQGWVELSFEIGKHAYHIVRTLKRGNGTIAQDSGYLMQDGIREDLTSTELKAHVLELLGYPSDLLGKGKSVLFRYTVYTPQEEMKRILEEAPEERLVTLRRLFGIEKYERVRDNAKIVLQSLREQERELDGVLARLPAQRALAAELEVRKQEVAAQLAPLMPQLAQARTAVVEGRTRIRENELKLNDLFALKRELATIEAQERIQNEQHARLEKDITALERQLAQAVPQQPIDATSIIATKRQTEQTMTETERAITDARGVLVELRTKASMSVTVAKGVENLETCPTCRQAVPRDHRARIMQEETAKCQALVAEQEHYNARLLSLTQQLTHHKQTVDALRVQEQQAAVRAMEHKLADERRSRHAALTDQRVLTFNALTTLRSQRESATIRLNALADVEKLHATLNKALQDAQEREKQLSVTHATLA